MKRKASSEDRRYAEGWPVGSVLKWDAPPTISIGAYGVGEAPSNEGTITMVVSGTAFVRFIINGKHGEPVPVLKGQPCEEL